MSVALLLARFTPIARELPSASAPDRGSRAIIRIAPLAGCTFSQTRTGEAVVLTVAGTVDMVTARTLAAAIDSAFAHQPRSIIIDLTAVDFLAAHGISQLVIAHERAQGVTQFGVVADGPATARPLRLVGTTDCISL